MTTTSNITEILKERGNNYGTFKYHAALTQALKVAFALNAQNFYKLSPSMREAIDMIFHKLGRIGNGDPNYLDSWIDIVGYTQLIVDELEEKAAESKAAESKAAKNKESV